MPKSDTQHEAAVEAAAKALYGPSGIVWEEQPQMHAHYQNKAAKAIAAYDAARRSETFTNDQIEAVVARMREGHWPDEWITQLQAVLRAARSSGEGERAALRYVLRVAEDSLGMGAFEEALRFIRDRSRAALAEPTA